MKKDVLYITKDKILCYEDLHEKLYNYLLSSADRKKLETQEYIQILATFEKITPLKTLKQLGYLHAEVYFKAWLSYMITQGKMEEEEAIGKLKQACGMAYSSGVPKSLEFAHIDEVSRFIDRAVVYINEDIGEVKCEDSKVWEKKKKIKLQEKEVKDE